MGESSEAIGGGVFKGAREERFNMAVGAFLRLGEEEFRHYLEGRDRSELAADALVRLKNESQSMRDYVLWHRYAAFLYVVDVSVYNAHRSVIEEKTNKALALLGDDAFIQGTEEGEVMPHLPFTVPFEKAMFIHTVRMDYFYKLLVNQKSLQGKRTCLAALQEFENKFQEMYRQDVVSGNGVKKFLDAKIGEEKEQLETSATLMNKATKNFLETKDQKDGAKLCSKLVERDGAFFYVQPGKNGDERTWAVTLWREPDPFFLTFRSIRSGEEGMVFVIDLIDGFEKIENDPESLNALATRAVDIYSAEQSIEQRKALDTYDLPKDRQTKYVRLLPVEHYDSAVAQALPGSTLTASVLKEHYGDAVDILLPIFYDNPLKAFRHTIETALKASPDQPLHFCVDILSHGSKNNFKFATPFTAHDLIALAKEYPQCSFTYNTIACYGGGAVDALIGNEEYKQSKDLQSRITLFTQTKGDIPNQMVDPTAAGTHYYLHFMRALKEGKTWGAAARTADIEVKQYMPLDAEAVIDGRKLVMQQEIAQENIKFA